jgi:hypothetical protein
MKEARFTGTVKFVRTVPKPYEITLRDDVTLLRENILTSRWRISTDYYRGSILKELNAKWAEIAVPPAFVVLESPEADRATCSRPFEVNCLVRGNGYLVEWVKPKVRKLPGVNVWVFDSVALGRESFRGVAPELILPIFPIDT